MIFIGIDWAEEHHDVCVLDAEGAVLGYRRVSSGIEGVRKLHALIAEHTSQPSEIAVGIEVDRGLLVGSLLAAGYQVYGINPFAANRYRERQSIAGAKSDRGDAKMLADLVRTDRHIHRLVAADSYLAEAVKVLARAHQALIWTRQRQVNNLRNSLRDFYPAALTAFGPDLASQGAVAVLQVAPTPESGSRLTKTKIRSALRRGGRERNIERRTAEISQHPRSENLHAPSEVADAYGVAVTSSVAVIAQLNAQIAILEGELTQSFDEHPDARIIRSLPGLGSVLGARILAEFGDAPNRYLKS